MVLYRLLSLYSYFCLVYKLFISVCVFVFGILNILDF